MVGMSKLPKLKIKIPFGYPNEDICELEQAKYRFNYGSGVVVLVEGISVKSHEELAQLAIQEEHKDKEFLEVVLVVDLIGGG